MSAPTISGLLATLEESIEARTHAALGVTEAHHVAVREARRAVLRYTATAGESAFLPAPAPERAA